MNRYDLKKRILEIFTSKQDIESELKTSIVSSEDVYIISTLYAIANSSERVRRLVEPWLRGVLSVSRSVGGKGSEQLLNLLYPARYEQYLFPYPILQEQKQESGISGEGGEGEKKKKFRIF